MPEPPKQHGHKQIAIRPERAHPVAAKRNIEIVSQPAGQGNVPTSPEIIYAEAGIGVIEILRDIIAKPPCHTDRHKRVAGKIKIDQARKGNGCPDQS